MQRLPVVSVALICALAACADPVTDPPSENPDALLGTESSNGNGNGNGNDDGDDRGSNNGRHISILDDCDPRDPDWAPTGGCTLRGGKVNVEEFDALLFSPLSQSTVGHPAWRNEPSYVVIETGDKVQVRNRGGRLHTFTPVAQFGGGRIPPLNQGLTMAPECALAPGAVDRWALTPGQKLDVKGLPLGNHRYMCCIHPWMRALVKVHRG
jgi:plastocyanin